ncbi:MAG TPA: helix-turn-helix domain-containing protein [Candidatus Wunengus sp. YC60]|uniref:helix-turn-helix domain-containing protein n=1 Tax=Candidatus Wunengus sp. YC60 TaxID=3367697 RepID=UPI0040294DD8
MPKEKLELGVYLKELRVVKNLSLRDVEKVTNNAVSNAYLSQLESGKINKPSPYILEQLAIAYGVPYEDVMVAAGYMRSSKTKRSGVAFFNQHDLSSDEKLKLLDYLQLIRKHKNEKR